jgi:hypothetical protein
MFNQTAGFFVIVIVTTPIIHSLPVYPFTLSTTSATKSYRWNCGMM